MTHEVAYNPLHGPRLAIAVIVLCIIAVFARGDDQSERDRKARVALALAGHSAPAIATAPVPHLRVPKDYPTGHKDAVTTQQPLVVFVGCAVQPVEGAVYCKCDSPTFGAIKAPAVVVGYPIGDRLMVDATLKGEPSREAVQKAVKEAARKIESPPMKAMPAPRPLDWQIHADAPPEKAGYTLNLPEGAEKYNGARYTQSISVLMDGGVNRDVIKPFPVKSVPDTRWRQAGGMEGITGYTSERYKSIPEGKQVKVWVGDVEVENSEVVRQPFGVGPVVLDKDGKPMHYRQNNRAILRSYPDGTRFDEVLTNSETGVVFEHRVRTKKDGKWLSEVWHKDEANYPAGYTGLKVSCSSCHAEAGTGKYDSGLVPGGDTVLSDPLPWSVAGIASPEETEEVGLFRNRRGASQPPAKLPDLPAKPTKGKSGCGCCPDCTCDSCPPGAKKPATPVQPAPKAIAPMQPRLQFMGYDRRGNPVYQLATEGGCAGGGCKLK